MLILKFKCEKCGETSAAVPIIKKVQVVGYDEHKIIEEIYITEIKCQKCGENHIVQIDNDYTYALLEKQKRLSFEIGTKRYRFGASDRRIKKTEGELQTVSKKLLKERDTLNKLYNNTDYVIDGEKIGTINFSYVKTKLIQVEEN